MNIKDMGVVSKAIAQVLHPKLEERDARIKALEEQLSVVMDRLEAIATKGIEFVGTWKQETEYQRGCLATFQGGLWHCNADTSDKPGTSSAWQLCVKSGGAK